ncbi:MAG: DNA photolyase family protein [Oligoflexia bacterium]|nr:DNA photolyase family protein [Oligoflexia bacterium]
MDHPISTSIFIFRRDLRLDDNTGLLAALELSSRVIPLFVLEPSQLVDNPYRSDNCVQFMFDALADLDRQLQATGAGLAIRQGPLVNAVAELIREQSVKGVFVNRDYTPFGRERDARLAELCRELGVEVHSYEDYLLTDPERTLKADGTPYTIFTPFRKNAARLEVRKPKSLGRARFVGLANPTPLENLRTSTLQVENGQLFAAGGRGAALKLLERAHQFGAYKEQRDFPALSATTGLSAHNKFGTVSIREVYAAFAERFGKEHTLISELYWRDFFTQIALRFPRVFGRAFNARYDRVEWPGGEEHFQRWCAGQTGFPIVDAGMRELNTTGFMHNRVRMIVASFLTKDLHVDWRRGERYFAQKLVDYDPAVNNGNWQWAASTGCDAQPYFRIFNPWLQQEKFDAQCLYVKRWVPELAGLAAKQIHGLGEESSTGVPGYPKPIVCHADEKLVTEELFQAALEP